MLLFILLCRSMTDLSEKSLIIEGGVELLRVMIVDDLEFARLEMRRLKLWGENSGFIISEEAGNGEEALQKLKKCRIDMIITDIKMPKIDGIELLRCVVEENLCPCVVLLSDFSEFSYARQGIILGAFDYMAKPVNEGELHELLKRAKEFISNKISEAERIKRLEEAFEDKINENLRSSDIERLIELIQNRNADVIDTVIHIIERMGANLNYDMLKVEAVLVKGISQVLEGLFANNSWLAGFVDTSGLLNITTSGFSKFEDIKTYIVLELKKVMYIMSTLQYGVQDKGIEWQVCNYILENIDSELSLKIIADKLYMNKTYISQVFKEKTGVSFIEYLTMVKMERAKLIIIEGNLKTYEIAEKLRFKDTEYFSKIFKKYTGMTPTDYRHKIKK